MNRYGRASGFTLVELLVVISIIVVLLSMLAPAMDRAVYEAEMAVCQTQHSAIARGASVYAMGFRRMYPYRPTMQSENGQFCRIQSRIAGGLGNDDRPILREFIGIKTFQDPLNPKVDYDTPLNDVWVLPSTWLLFGGRGIIDPAKNKHQAMTKVGDRLKWQGSTHPGWTPNDSGIAREWAFDYLTSEEDWNRLSDEIRTAHPDDAGLLEAQGLQGESVFLVLNGFRSRWIARSANRGKIHQNFARADGSTRRLNNIENHDRNQTVEIPEFEDDGSNFPSNAGHLPVD
jgi:prepilin-type N-terminal cleavage/methylation domain-containing protein